MAWEREVSTPRQKPRVVIAISHTIHWTAEFSEKTYGPLRWIAQPDFDKVPRLLRGIPIAVARNELVKMTLEDPANTHIFFVDSDTIFEDPSDPNQALRFLLACNAPITSGLYRAKQKVGFNYAMWVKAKGGYVPVQKWSEGSNWIRVDAIGVGCCLIKREVFEKIPPPWFVWDKPEPSEDFYFCQKVIEHGYEIRVLTDIKCSHIGTLAVQPDGSVRTLRV